MVRQQELVRMQTSDKRMHRITRCEHVALYCRWMDIFANLVNKDEVGILSLTNNESWTSEWFVMIVDFVFYKERIKTCVCVWRGVRMLTQLQYMNEGNFCKQMRNKERKLLINISIKFKFTTRLFVFGHWFDVLQVHNMITNSTLPSRICHHHQHHHHRHQAELQTDKVSDFSRQVVFRIVVIVVEQKNKIKYIPDSGSINR